MKPKIKVCYYGGNCLIKTVDASIASNYWRQAVFYLDKGGFVELLDKNDKVLVGWDNEIGGYGPALSKYASLIETDNLNHIADVITDIILTEENK